MHLGINRFRCTCTKPWRVKLAVQDAEALLERNLCFIWQLLRVLEGALNHISRNPALPPDP